MVQTTYSLKLYLKNFPNQQKEIHPTKEVLRHIGQTDMTREPMTHLSQDAKNTKGFQDG